MEDNNVSVDQSIDLLELERCPTVVLGRKCYITKSSMFTKNQIAIVDNLIQLHFCIASITDQTLNGLNLTGGWFGPMLLEPRCKCVWPMKKKLSLIFY